MTGDQADPAGTQSPDEKSRAFRPGRRIAAAAVVWLLVAAVLRFTLLAPETCFPTSSDETHRTAVAAADWIAGNQFDDGLYLYLYNRADETAPDAYNLVRHAGTTMALYQLVEAGETTYLAAADRAMDYMLGRLIPTAPGATAWAEPGENPQLGAAALMAVSLLTRRNATGDTQYDDVLRGLGSFMVGQQLADGVMLERWLIEDQAPDFSQRSRYATGESLWALALLHDAFPGEGWDEPAWRTLDYLSLRRDAEEELFPRPWPDQWAAYSLETMGGWGLEDHHIAYARSLAAQFGVQVRWDSQRSGGLTTLSHPPEPRGAGFGTVLEGLGMMRSLAAQDERMADMHDDLADRLACGASRLAAAQVTEDETISSSPERETGAWFLNDETRMDDQQHAASGMLWVEIALKRAAP